MQVLPEPLRASHKSVPRWPKRTWPSPEPPRRGPHKESPTYQSAASPRRALFTSPLNRPPHFQRVTAYITTLPSRPPSEKARGPGLCCIYQSAHRGTWNKRSVLVTFGKSQKRMGEGRRKWKREEDRLGTSNILSVIVNLYASLTGSLSARYLAKRYFWMCLWMVLGEMSI